METEQKHRKTEKCKADECSRLIDHPVSGYCHKHYKRMHRNGTLSVKRNSTGNGTTTTYGYVALAKKGKKFFEHVLIAENALGKKLPISAEVHHINGIRNDNRHENLVICPDRAYHKLLHVRQNAFEVCGNANYRKCPFCKQYDDTLKMAHNKSSRYFYHSECKKAYNRERHVK